MKIRKLKIKNFMSFGNEYTIIDFEKLNDNKIIVLSGINEDIDKDKEEFADNGSGKSSLYEAISYALFDSTPRDLNKDDYINNINNKDMVVELEVDDIKIIRGRKPNFLKLFIDKNHIFGPETEKTLSMQLTQNEINNILKADYDSFINLFCIGQHNNFSFITTKAETKRKIIENLLNIEDFNLHEQDSKCKCNLIKKEISILEKNHENIKSKISNINDKIEDYKLKSISYKDDVEKEINDIRKKIDIDIDTNEIYKLWNDYENKKNKLKNDEENIRNIEKNISSISNIMTPIIIKLKDINNDLEKINNLKKGVICKTCYQVVDPDNIKIKEELQNNKDKLLKDVEEPEKNIKDLRIKLKELIEKFNRDNKECICPTISKEKLAKIESDKENNIKNIEQLEKRLLFNPYVDMIDSLYKELNELSLDLENNIKDIKLQSELLKYYQFWVSGFGEKGIKSFIVKRILNYLNQRVNYWLSIIIDNKIKLEFDELLNVSIKRDIKDKLNKDLWFTYKQGSGGEKRRIDLSIMLGFSDVMQIRTGIDINILFLDEVVESIDKHGINGIYKLLLELSKNKNVFIITHREDLLKKLEGVKKLVLIKKNGFTKLL